MILLDLQPIHAIPVPKFGPGVSTRVQMYIPTWMPIAMPIQQRGLHFARAMGRGRKIWILMRVCCMCRGLGRLPLV